MDFHPSARPHRACLVGRLLFLALLGVAVAWPVRGQQIDSLAYVIRNGDTEERSTAAYRLREIGGEEVVGPLTECLLRDLRSRNRAECAEHLGNVGQALSGASREQTVQALARALQNDDAFFVHHHAIESLIQLGGAKAAQALVERLQRVGTPLRENDEVIIRSEAAQGLWIGGNRAVDPLVGVLTDENEATSVRVSTVSALQQIGGDGAVASLADALKSTNADVRTAAVRALGRTGNQQSVEPLLEVLQDLDAEVRAASAEALGLLEAKEAIDALTEALQDNVVPVRLNAVYALGRIAGVKAERALLGALATDEKVTIRAAAATMLGETGFEQATDTLVRSLTAALSDTVAIVSRAAADALTPIALGLMIREEGDLWLLFEEAGSAMRSGNFSQNQIRMVDATAKSLRAFWRVDEGRLINRARTFLGNNSWAKAVLGILVYVFVLLIFWTALLFLRPLWLLRLNERFDWSFPKSTPHIGGDSLRHLLLLSPFYCHPRVLNAWVNYHLPYARQSFEKLETVRARTVHIGLPVQFNNEYVSPLKPSTLQPLFAREVAGLLIQGEGGSGKTSWACQIARWGMENESEDRLHEHHRMLPVLLDGEFDDFVEAVRARVQGLIGDKKPMPKKLLEKLLEEKRLLVIVDHLSEASPSVRAAVNSSTYTLPANALIVTSRLEEPLDGRTYGSIEPLRVQGGNSLARFVWSYLEAQAKEELFPDESEFYDLLKRLLTLVGDRGITVLLAKLYAEQMIAKKKGTIASLPKTIPDLILEYINILNQQAAPDEPNNRTVHQAAKLAAWYCVEDMYRPGPAKLPVIEKTWNGDDGIWMYLDEKLRLVQTIRPAENRIQFNLDPLAEYLAALYFVECTGDDEKAWQTFLEEAKAKPDAPGAIRGFLLAVRDCCLHLEYGAFVPGWVLEELERQVGSGQTPVLKKERLAN